MAYSIVVLIAGTRNRDPLGKLKIGSLNNRLRLLCPKTVVIDKILTLTRLLSLKASFLGIEFYRYVILVLEVFITFLI